MEKISVKELSQLEYQTTITISEALNVHDIVLFFNDGSVSRYFKELDASENEEHYESEDEIDEHIDYLTGEDDLFEIIVRNYPSVQKIGIIF